MNEFRIDQVRSAIVSANLTLAERPPKALKPCTLNIPERRTEGPPQCMAGPSHRSLALAAGCRCNIGMDGSGSQVKHQCPGRVHASAAVGLVSLAQGRHYTRHYEGPFRILVGSTGGTSSACCSERSFCQISQIFLPAASVWSSGAMECQSLAVR